MNHKFAIIDLETTGGRPGKDKITEIAIIVYDGDSIIDEFQSLINPERSIPSNITRITGITNSMVADAPKFYEVAKTVIEKTEGCVFVAHNVRFDYGFMVEEFRSLGFSFNRKKICTVKLSRMSFPGLASYSLGKLIQHFDIKVENRHRAYDDAFATTILLQKIFDIQDSEKHINDIITDSIKLTNLPKSLKPEDVMTLPQLCGVYYMIDEDGDIVYIGKSVNIQKRIKQHFSKLTRKTDRLFQSVSKIHYEITGSELVSLILESAEIKKHQPPINRAQKTRDYKYAVVKAVDKSGYFKFEVKQSHHAKDPLSFYSNKKNAKNHLAQIGELYQLCHKINGIDSHTSACFNYSLNKCLGACIGEEMSYSYNERFIESLVNINRIFEKDFFIVENGKILGEKAIILIENGHFKAYGYIDQLISSNSIEDLKSHLKMMKMNQDADNLIRNYIWNNPNIEIHYI